ncbi:MAG: Cell division protein FtsX [Patescibacteria group bacterium]|jgi:cell division transport system permease protein|nr:Cell division protein FtsX [Patescibacteria group bacterium]
MKVLDIRRIVRGGFLNFVRNSFVSLSSVLVMTITLCVISLIIFSQAVLNYSLSELKDKVDVTVFFTTNAPESEILSLKEQLEKLPEVASVDYVSSEQALENFKKRHEDDYLTLQALEELDGNPLGATLNIQAIEASEYEEIANFFEDGDILESNQKVIIEKVNYFQNKLVIERLVSITEGARKLGIAVTLILVLISVVITFNTLRLTIYISRDEIAVMRVVGAENHYIRGPFMVEGMIYGFISALITMIIFYPISLWLGANMTEFLGINLYTYYLSNFFQLLIITSISGMLLGVISSFLATRTYLKK